MNGFNNPSPFFVTLVCGFGLGLIDLRSAWSAECAAPGPNCVMSGPHCYGPDRPQQAQQQSTPMATQQAVQQAAPGMYQQPPATGDFEGESSGMGIRGPGLTLPSIHFEGASLRLPRLFKTRSGARMRTDPQYAPYVPGPAAQFGMLQHIAQPVVATQQATAVPVQQPAPEAKQQAAPESCVPSEVPVEDSCIPPMPCSKSERALLEALSRKDAEIRELKGQFNHMEQMIGQLVEQKELDANRRVPPSPAQEPIVGASFLKTQSDETATRAATPGRVPATEEKPDPVKQKSSVGKPLSSFKKLFRRSK